MIVPNFLENNSCFEFSDGTNAHVFNVLLKLYGYIDELTIQDDGSYNYYMFFVNNSNKAFDVIGVYEIYDNGDVEFNFDVEEYVYNIQFDCTQFKSVIQPATMYKVSLLEKLLPYMNLHNGFTTFLNGLDKWSLLVLTYNLNCNPICIYDEFIDTNN